MLRIPVNRYLGEKALLALVGLLFPSLLTVVMGVLGIGLPFVLPVLGGLDSLVFTGGIGERAVEVRAAICDRLHHLGVVVDRNRNAASEPVISADSSAVAVRVVLTDEDVVVARHTLDLVRPS